MCRHLPSPLNTQITSFSVMDGCLTHPCILNHWCGLWHAESTQWAFIELNSQMSSSSFSQQVLNCSKISNECLHTTLLNLIKNESQRGTGAEPLSCCDFGVLDLCSNHSLSRQAQGNLELGLNIFRDQREFVGDHGKSMGFGVYKLILSLRFIIYYIQELEKVTKFSEPQFTHL